MLSNSLNILNKSNDNICEIPFNKIITEIDHKNITDKIEILRNMPQPTQRTKEWYDLRHNLITASNVHKIMGSEVSSTLQDPVIIIVPLSNGCFLEQTTRSFAIRLNIKSFKRTTSHNLIDILHNLSFVKYFCFFTKNRSHYM